MLSLLFATFEWIKYEVTKNYGKNSWLNHNYQVELKQKVTTCCGSKILLKV